MIRRLLLYCHPVKARILHALDNGHGFGLDIMAVYGIHSGALYPALMRLQTAGVVVSRWEDPAPVGRPRRRVYEIAPGLDRSELRARPAYRALNQLVPR